MHKSRNTTCIGKNLRQIFLGCCQHQKVSPADRLIFQTIKALVKKTDLTVLLVEQNAIGALKIADEGIVLNLGTVVAVDSAQSLLNDPAVRAAYLGF